MRARHPLCCAAALLALALPVRAELPDGTLVVIKGLTVDAGALPLLLSLGSGVHSAGEIAAPFQTAAYQPTDLLAFEAGARFAQVLEPGSPVPIATAAYYYDPSLNATVPVSVALSGSASIEALPVELPDGSEQTLATLLDAPGSAVVFSLPEPAGVLVFTLGALEVAWLSRRRRQRGPTEFQDRRLDLSRHT